MPPENPPKAPDFTLTEERESRLPLDQRSRKQPRKKFAKTAKRRKALKPEFTAALFFVGENMRKWRAKRGWTQQQLAEAMDSHLGHIQKIENAEIDPSFTYACDIAKALGVGVGRLGENFPGRLKKMVKVPGLGVRYICYVGTPDVPNDADGPTRSRIAKEGFDRLGEERV